MPVPLTTEPSPNAGFINPGIIHSVLVTGLAPATVYYYRYGNAIEGFSGVKSFASALPASPDTPVSFIAIGDLGLSAAPGIALTLSRWH